MVTSSKYGLSQGIINVRGIDMELWNLATAKALIEGITKKGDMVNKALSVYLKSGKAVK